MDAYEALDLSVVCNAGDELLNGQVPRGEQMFCGLPFLVGSTALSGKNCFVAGGGELGTQGISIPVGKQVCWAVVAHRLLESRIREGGAIGETVAEYCFYLEGGEQVRVPIRERFEISTVPAEGGAPFLAVPD